MSSWNQSHPLFQSDNKPPARPNHLSRIMPSSLSKSKPASSEKVEVALREVLSSGEKEVIRRLVPRGYGSALDRTLRILKVTLSF